MPYMATHVLDWPVHWRMLPTSANGQPAVAAGYRGTSGGYLPYGIVVLTADVAGFSRTGTPAGRPSAFPVVWSGATVSRNVLEPRPIPSRRAVGL